MLDGMTLPELSVPFVVGISLLAVWEAIWKGVGLWRAARNQHVAWFVVILIFNTAGILPIVYLWLVDRRKGDKHGLSP